jgi:hypothetical protein
MRKDRITKEEIVSRRNAAGEAIDVENIVKSAGRLAMLPIPSESWPPTAMYVSAGVPSSDPLKARAGSVCTGCRRTRPSRCTPVSNAETGSRWMICPFKRAAG